MDFVQIGALLQALKQASPTLTETSQHCIGTIDVSWCGVVKTRTHDASSTHSAMIEHVHLRDDGFFFSSFNRDAVQRRIASEISTIRHALHHLVLDTSLHHPDDQLLRSVILALRKHFDP